MPIRALHPNGRKILNPCPHLVSDLLNLLKRPPFPAPIPFPATALASIGLFTPLAKINYKKFRTWLVALSALFH
jgi:hypothetical protein